MIQFIEVEDANGFLRWGLKFRLSNAQEFVLPVVLAGDFIEAPEWSPEPTFRLYFEELQHEPVEIKTKPAPDDKEPRPAELQREVGIVDPAPPPVRYARNRDRNGRFVRGMHPVNS